MLRTYRLIWTLLTPPERRRFLTLLAMTMVMAVFDVIGVGGILPFLSVLANPGLIETNPILIRFAEVFGLETTREVTVGLGFAVFALVLLSTVIRAVVTYAQIRFSLMRSYSLSSRLLRGHLGQSWVWFLSRNTADLGTTLLSEVDRVVRDSILPSILLISNGLVIVMIGTLLFLVEPTVAVGATVLLLGVYVVVYFTLRGRLDDIGRKRMVANRDRFLVIQEISGGMKTLKVRGLEGQNLQRFSRPAKSMAQHETLGLVISRLPRFAVEAAVYGAFIGMILFMILRGDAIADLLPLLGLLGMAATRLFPALQQVYQEMSRIQFSAPALERLSRELRELGPPPPPLPDLPPLHLDEALELRDIRFRYPGTERDTLQGFSAVIPARSTLGVVGGTGAGKTTVIDIILGLLVPSSGHMLVDGQEVGPHNIRAWQKTIGYVPQDIFLADESVAANIAFGVDPSRIDAAAVERAARIANLHDFIMSELPMGYATPVGERGVRLSGGQRQRIGIARALYHDPDVLILDEATSALDNLTERAVMEAVHNLGGKKTIIMIAHRLTSVQDCDRIFLLEQGRLVAQGTYEDLVERSEKFRLMANV